MGQGIILMVTSIQKWDTAFSGGILTFESWYPNWILKKYLNFRPCIVQVEINNSMESSWSSGLPRNIELVIIQYEHLFTNEVQKSK